MALTKRSVQGNSSSRKERIRMYQRLSRVVHLTCVDHFGSSLMGAWEPQIQPRRKPHDYIVGFWLMRAYYNFGSRYSE
jgi:hypothetical protein